MNLIEILRNAGCKPKSSGNTISCAATYRGGDNTSAVCIYLNTNKAHDFVTGKTMSIPQFLQKTLGLQTEDAALNLIKGTNEYNSPCFASFDSEDPFTKTSKYFSSEDMASFKEDYSYWNKRGISDETLKIFCGGLCVSGKMRNKYVFPIINSRKKIEGFSGRDTTGKHPIKWKNIGHKLDWAYPLVYTHSYISEKDQVILVESIGDMLSLWESGIKNIGVTFGTDIGNGLLKAILRLDPKQIIIATNLDENSAGQKGGQKIRTKLLEFFDESQVKIAFPIKNDFGAQTKEENLEWYNSIK